MSKPKQKTFKITVAGPLILVPMKPSTEEESELCPHCNGDGCGIVGLDWECEDPINGPYDGEIERCPFCHGSGKAEDVSIW